MFTTTPLSNAQALSYQNAGFEMGAHIYTGSDRGTCGNFTPSSLQASFNSQLAAFATQFPSLPAQVSHRAHCIAWSDYTTMAEQELSRGIRLDTTYYYWPSTYVRDNPGFFTGSGIPMRFAKSDGTTLDIYQATTQMTDESGQSYPYTIDSLLDNAIGPPGYYGAFVANMHTDSVASSGSDAIIVSARARNIPIISARQLLTWVDGRNASEFDSIAWNGTTLTFSVSVGTGANGLRAMVPIPPGRTISSMTVNGSPVPFGTATIKGINYVYFQVSAGSYTLEFRQ